MNTRAWNGVTKSQTGLSSIGIRQNSAGPVQLLARCKTDNKRRCRQKPLDTTNCHGKSFPILPASRSINMKLYHFQTGKYRSSAGGDGRSDHNNQHYFHETGTLTEAWLMPLVPRSGLDRADRGRSV